MPTGISGELSRDEAILLLTQQDVAVRGMMENWPHPRWIKIWHDGEDFPRMAWVNRAYCEWYEVAAHDYVGKSDCDVWPVDVCHAYRDLDLSAIKAGGIVEAREPTPRGKSGVCKTRKFAFRIDNSGVHGWGIYGECEPE